MKKQYIEPITVWMKEIAKERLFQDTWDLAASPSHGQTGTGAPARRGAGLDGPAGL